MPYPPFKTLHVLPYFYKRIKLKIMSFQRQPPIPYLTSRAPVVIRRSCWFRDSYVAEDNGGTPLQPGVPEICQQRPVAPCAPATGGQGVHRLLRQTSRQSARDNGGNPCRKRVPWRWQLMASKHMQCGLGTLGAEKWRVSGNGQVAERRASLTDWQLRPTTPCMQSPGEVHVLPHFLKMFKIMS